MPQFIHAVLCQQAITDQETNQVSYINILEQLRIPQSVLPLQLPAIVVGTLWRRNKPSEELHIRIRATAPGDEKAVFEPPPVIMEKGRHRLNLRLTGIVVEADGDYVFHVDLDTGRGKWKEVAVLPLTVEVEQGA